MNIKRKIHAFAISIKNSEIQLKYFAFNRIKQCKGCVKARNDSKKIWIETCECFFFFSSFHFDLSLIKETTKNEIEKQMTFDAQVNGYVKKYTLFYRLKCFGKEKNKLIHFSTCGDVILKQIYSATISLKVYINQNQKLTPNEFFY